MEKSEKISEAFGAWKGSKEKLEEIIEEGREKFDDYFKKKFEM